MGIETTYVCDACDAENRDCESINNDPIDYALQKLEVSINLGTTFLCDSCKSHMGLLVEEAIESIFENKEIERCKN